MFDPFSIVYHGSLIYLWISNLGLLSWHFIFKFLAVLHFSVSTYMCQFSVFINSACYNLRLRFLYTPRACEAGVIQSLTGWIQHFTSAVRVLTLWDNFVRIYMDFDRGNNPLVSHTNFFTLSLFIGILTRGVMSPVWFNTEPNGNLSYILSCVKLANLFHTKNVSERDSKFTPPAFPQCWLKNYLSLHSPLTQLHVGIPISTVKICV